MTVRHRGRFSVLQLGKNKRSDFTPLVFCIYSFQIYPIAILKQIGKSFLISPLTLIVSAFSSLV